jgi:hypothetical protein
MSFTFGGKQEYQPLQAADMLAYLAADNWVRYYGVRLPTRRFSLDRLNTIPHSYKNVAPETMERSKDSILEALAALRL